MSANASRGGFGVTDGPVARGVQEGICRIIVCPCVLSSTYLQFSWSTRKGSLATRRVFPVSSRASGRFSSFDVVGRTVGVLGRSVGALARSVLAVKRNQEIPTLCRKMD